MPDLMQAVAAISESVGKAIARVEGEFSAQLRAVKDAVDSYRDSLKAEVAELAKRADSLDAQSESRVAIAIDTAKAYCDERIAALPMPQKGDKGDPGESIKGEVGPRGPSAYEVALERGFSGSEQEWFESLRGPAGKDGESGEPGLKGDPGESIVGPPGDPGPPGKGAYELAVAKGFDGSEDDWLASLRGPQGLRGEAGESIRGEKGEPGESIKGEKGDRGDDGQSAYEIAKAEGFVGSRLDWIQSLRGKDGSAGLNGKDGADGRDALQIDILPTIDETRSYPKATYAIVRGALCKAMRQTGAIKDSLDSAGWQVLIDAAPSLEVIQGEDLRTFTIRTVYASGTVIDKEFKLPVVLERGVWDREKAYDRGDMVVYGGQIWIGQGEIKGEKPGDSPAWRLSVRKGRDAAPEPKPQSREPIKLQ